MKPEFTTPRRRLEHLVTLCWSEVLGRPDIGPEDNFFDMGGTSFQAVKLRLLLQQRLNADVLILTLFQYPSVRGFVKTFLAAQGTGPRPNPLMARGAHVQAAMTTALSPAERAVRQREAFQSRRSSADTRE